MQGKHSPQHIAPSKSAPRRKTRVERTVTEPKPLQERPETINEQQGAAAPKKRNLLFLIIQDILLTGLALCVFALFHHVLPRLNSGKTPSPTPIAIATPLPTPVPTPVLTETETELEPTPEVTDDRTEWKRKFEEHFSEETISTENSYKSSEVSITITTHTTDDPVPSTYFVADIYIAQIENFQTYLASGEYKQWASETPVDIDRNSGAILAINGDYCNNQYTGFLVRNGELYMTEQTSSDICVLYYDGTMETYAPDEYIVEDVIARNPYQVWKFGPELLDENGQPNTSWNTGDAIRWENPRSGIGYYEPGHYCFIVVDGRQQGYSRGLEIEKFAQLFSDLGCVSAYNMDGGASACMTFNDAVYNKPASGGRDLGDILLIREVGAEEGEG